MVAVVAGRVVAAAVVGAQAAVVVPVAVVVAVVEVEVEVAARPAPGHARVAVVVVVVAAVADPEAARLHRAAARQSVDALARGATSAPLAKSTVLD